MNFAPTFMFGFERSGTTLLGMMVGAHPQIAVPMAVTGLWFRYARRLSEYNGLASDADCARLVDDLLAEERIALWNAKLDRNALLDGLAVGSFGAIVERFHAQYARAHGKRLWANLEIQTLDDMDEVQRWFPDARFVHIVRDGRDVALSHRTMPYGAANLGDCAQSWLARVGTNLKMGAMLPADRYLVLRYEDLVTDSNAVLARLCAFLGVEYSDAMLDYPRHVDSKVPAAKRWLWPTLDQPPRSDGVGRWRGDLSAAEQGAFESIAGGLLERLDYETVRIGRGRWRAQGLELWYFLDRGGGWRRLRSRLGLARASRLERDWKRRQTGGDPS